MKKNSLLLIIVLALMVQIISAQSKNRDEDCGFYAYVIDNSSAGLNVRDKPDIKGKIITKLKSENPNDEGFAVKVFIVKFFNGWAKIREVDGSGTVQLNDLGWVSAKMLSTGVQNPSDDVNPVQVYNESQKFSKKLYKFPSGAEMKIVGFTCPWVKVAYKGRTGWVDKMHICGNPVTTCD